MGGNCFIDDACLASHTGEDQLQTIALALIFPADPGSCEKRHHLPILKVSDSALRARYNSNSCWVKPAASKARTWRAADSTASRPAQNNPP